MAKSASTGGASAATSTAESADVYGAASALLYRCFSLRVFVLDRAKDAL